MESQFKESVELLQYFVDRVENGTIRSSTTYMKYKNFLDNLNKEGEEEKCSICKGEGICYDGEEGVTYRCGKCKVDELNLRLKELNKIMTSIIYRNYANNLKATDGERSKIGVLELDISSLEHQLSELLEGKEEKFIQPGETICNCPECGAEIQYGFSEETTLKIRDSKLFKQPSREKIIEVLTSYLMGDNNVVYPNSFPYIASELSEEEKTCDHFWIDGRVTCGTEVCIKCGEARLKQTTPLANKETKTIKAEEILKDNLSDNLWDLINSTPVAYKADEMLISWIIKAMEEYASQKQISKEKIIEVLEKHCNDKGITVHDNQNLNRAFVGAVMELLNIKPKFNSEQKTTDEEIIRWADKITQVPLEWNRLTEGAKAMRDNQIK